MYITPYLIDEVDDGSGGLLGLELGEHVALVVGARRRARHEREDTSAEVSLIKPFSIILYSTISKMSHVFKISNISNFEQNLRFGKQNESS